MVQNYDALLSIQIETNETFFNIFLLLVNITFSILSFTSKNLDKKLKVDKTGYRESERVERRYGENICLYKVGILNLTPWTLHTIQC